MGLLTNGKFWFLVAGNCRLAAKLKLLGGAFVLSKPFMIGYYKSELLRGFL